LDDAGAGADAASDASLQDGPLADTGVDTATDGPIADTAQVDSVLPDSATTDTAQKDSVLPDSATTDSAQKDSAQPDGIQPDSVQPDSAAPDQAVIPDGPLADQSTADLSACNNNGTAETGELCDGLDLKTQTCLTLGYQFGALKCKYDCTFDTSACHKHTWRVIPAGTFKMGNVTGDPCYGALSGDYLNEYVITATLIREYLISAHEVTVDKYKALMKVVDPSSDKACGGTCPVENVTWHQAVLYCNALSTIKGLTPCYTCTGSGPGLKCDVPTQYAGSGIHTCQGYRLPTEAEWERAYRAGTATPLYNGWIASGQCKKADTTLNKIAWYDYQGGKKKHVVGGLAKNDWWLYDMAGNVWEWVHDWHVINRQTHYGKTAVTDPVVWANLSYHTVKGGAFDRPAYQCRGSARWWLVPNKGAPNLGFRCAKTRCQKILHETFSAFSGWTNNSLVLHDTTAGNHPLPKAAGGVYQHQTINNKGGGHRNSMGGYTIKGPAFEIRSRMRGDPDPKKTGRTVVGLFKNNVYETISGTIQAGRGYGCTWDAKSAKVQITLIAGSKGESTLAEAAAGFTPDALFHDVVCARLEDGSWEIYVDKKKLTLSQNTKDLTYPELKNVSTYLSSDSTLRALEEITIRDCN